jgi:hypothetical protein
LPEPTDKANKGAILCGIVPMTRAGPLTRLNRLSAERKRLLVRAVFVLTAASAAVACLPFRRAIRLGSVPVAGVAETSIEDCVWAVEAAARRLPWRSVCIDKGLAVQRMLRSGGVEAVLHYGARHHPDERKLEAHVWVTVGDRAVIGGDEAAEFAPLATYP